MAKPVTTLGMKKLLLALLAVAAVALVAVVIVENTPELEAYIRVDERFGRSDATIPAAVLPLAVAFMPSILRAARGRRQSLFLPLRSIVLN